ncbi:helix-turn-helix domain-containing transcriptional regulator [Helicobacter bizzozeronii]|uniref:helix-turn-helix domain-containing transcriptional regulator n=1 Tax=Helicobacter bizzozeronii TaxID=56877 RepID=UPI000CEE0B77|nr:hypothetical protein [Helicobacter bizzozeronii]
MEVTFSPFRVAQMLDTEERRLSYLNAVLEDGDVAELKDALEVIAESKGIDLPPFDGDTLEFMRILKKLGFGLHSLEPSKNHTA